MSQFREMPADSPKYVTEAQSLTCWMVENGISEFVGLALRSELWAAKDRITALEAKCALLSASLKQADACSKEINAALSDGMVLAPHYRGYARLGTGQYLLNNSAAGSEPEFVISVATDEEKAGRVVGDERMNKPSAVLRPEAMAVRIAFVSVAGLDAMENQLRKLRAEHFPSSTETSGVGEREAALIEALRALEEAARKVMTGEMDVDSIAVERYKARAALAQVQAQPIYQARSPEGDPWQEVTAEQYAQAARNGYETRVLCIAPAQPADGVEGAQ